MAHHTLHMPITEAQVRELRAGDTVTLEPNVVGSTPFHFQWLKNGTAIPGAVGNALVLANASPSDSGLYSSWPPTPPAWP